MYPSPLERGTVFCCICHRASVPQRVTNATEPNGTRFPCFLGLTSKRPCFLACFLSLSVPPSLTQASALELDAVTSALYQRGADFPSRHREGTDGETGKANEEKKMPVKDPKALWKQRTRCCRSLTAPGGTLCETAAELGSRSSRVSSREQTAQMRSGKLTPSYGRWDCSFHAPNTLRTFPFVTGTASRDAPQQREHAPYVTLERNNPLCGSSLH